MADIFQVAPPIWLQELTRSNDKGLLGGIAGELVGGGLIAATKVGAEAKQIEGETGKKPSFLNESRMWLNDLPKSIAEAHLNFLDPMWKIKVQHQQLDIANKALGLQEMQQKINLNKTLIQNSAEDQKNIPKWLQEHPTWESRKDAEWPAARTQQWNKNLNDLRLRDSQSVQSKVTTEGIKEFGKRIDTLSKLDPIAAGQIASQTRPGEVPSPDTIRQLGEAESVAATKQQQRIQGLESGTTPLAPGQRTTIKTPTGTETFTGPKAQTPEQMALEKQKLGIKQRELDISEQRALNTALQIAERDKSIGVTEQKAIFTFLKGNPTLNEQVNKARNNVVNSQVALAELLRQKAGGQTFKRSPFHWARTMDEAISEAESSVKSAQAEFESMQDFVKQSFKGVTPTATTPKEFNYVPGQGLQPVK